MAASPEVFLAAPEPFSPSIFLNLPVTPRPDSNGDGKDPRASSDDLVGLPLIERMLMKDEGMDDDSFLYQFPNDDPALLRALEPYAQILSDSSSSDASTTTLPESSGDKSLALLNDADDEEMKKQSNAMFAAGHAALASAFFSDQDGGPRAMLRVAFLKGMQEANKFLPRDIQQVPATVQVKEEDENGNDSNGRGRKTNRHDVDFNWGDVLVLEADTGRKSKLLAPEPEESGEVVDEMVANGYEMFLREVESLRISMEDGELSADHKKKKKNRQRKGQSSPSNGTVVDLCTLLIHCAQAVAADDRRSATQLLTQIKRHSSPSGDATQRLAHCFAQGLEARLAGPGSQVYESSLMAKQHNSAVDFLKAYRLFTAACCFRMMAFKFANMTICRAIDDSGRRKVHIVDYGIHYGSQWPGLLKFFSTWPGGSPEVRITGVDLPQLGFRPAARVEETGRRLTSYASRFGVPFRFHGIAAKWETVTVHDLDIDPDEVLIVNSILHFGNLMDEGVDPSSPSPRDVVLTNILFTGNGSYSTPYFVPRFREALLHYSTMFDMMDATTPRDSDLRILVERDLFGRCVQNAIACEGLDRVERPETYKQWQRRNHRAGLRQVPLDLCIVKSVRDSIRDQYHEDFLTDVDSQWLLGGWKGRILYAMSTWAADDAISQSN